MKTIAKNTPCIRIGVVDSDPIRFVGFCTLLAAQSDLEPVNISFSDVCGSTDIDVVLLWNQSEPDTMNALRRLRALNTSIPVVLTGKRMEDTGMIQALELGVRGRIEETMTAQEFARAIRAVRNGSIWISRRVLSAFIEQRQSTLYRASGSYGQRLTARELEVLNMLVAGRSNKEIGIPLGIEERTVKAHVARLMRKVGVKNRIMLSVQAIERALVSLQ